MQALVNAGADIIELGVPFSDPMADGPVIQRASERALANGTNTDDVFNMVYNFRQKNDSIPIVLMGYLNPVEIMGYRKFTARAREAGVDGVLIVDLPPEESAGLNAELRSNNLDQIFLLSPTTTTTRLQRICEIASGFLYYVSLKGVTGSNRLDVDEVSARLDEIRTQTTLPLGVGFGVKDPNTAAAVGKICDAVIIGSALVERIAKYTGENDGMQQAVSTFVAAIRNALDK